MSSMYYSISPVANPSCWQITTASFVPNLPLHTVPHALLIHTSKRPIVAFRPPTNLTAPSPQSALGVEGSARINYYTIHKQSTNVLYYPPMKAMNNNFPQYFWLAFQWHFEIISLYWMLLIYITPALILMLQKSLLLLVDRCPCITQKAYYLRLWMAVCCKKLVLLHYEHCQVQFM